ncbi:hypothetical protein JMUB7530_28060 [Staphylococcus aureus]
MSRGLGDVYKRQGHDAKQALGHRIQEFGFQAVSYTHLTLPTN